MAKGLAEGGRQYYVLEFGYSPKKYTINYCTLYTTGGQKGQYFCWWQYSAFILHKYCNNKERGKNESRL